MPPAAPGVRFVVDENLLRLGKALAQLRPDLVCFGDPRVADLLPQGVDDSAWIPVVGDQGWIVLTNDRRLRTRPAEADLAIRYRLKVIHLHGAVGHQAAWDQAVRVMSRWAAIEQHVERAPDGPWWLSVQRGGVRPLRFEPGIPERGA